MDGATWREIAIAGIALLTMAAASTGEAIAQSISRQRLRHVAEAQNRSRTVQSLLDPRRALTASFVVIQAVAVAVAASFLTTIVGREFDTIEHLLAIVLVVLAYLIVGRAVPMALVDRQPNKAASVLIRLSGGFTLIAWPLTTAADRLAHLMMAVIPGSTVDPATAGEEEELRAIAMESGDSGIIEAEEREMIDGVLRLEEMTARDIMVPRVDMVAVERSATPAETIDTITRAGHSRIPVFEESIDHIVGILYAKDLLPYVVGTTDQMPPLTELMRPAFVVPESKRADDLLKELRRNRVHIAIVADEYGGTAGMCTFEDILEEIVGEIHDEYDVAEPLFERIADDVLIADGRLLIEDAEESLHVSFTDDDYGTLGGFVHKHLGRLPRDGDRFTAEGVDVEILNVEGNRVRRMRLRRRGIHDSDTASTAANDPHDPPRSSPDPEHQP